MRKSGLIRRYRKAVATTLLVLFASHDVFAAGLTLQPGATLTLTGAPTVSLAGDLRNQGSIAAGSSTVVFYGSGSSAVESGLSSLNNLTIQKTAAADGDDNVTVQLDPLAVTGVTTIQDGELIQGGVDLALNGITLAAAGKYTNIGAADLYLSGPVANSGTILFDGNGIGAGQPDDILIRSSVNGTQRNWQGPGTFSMTDVDVMDQTCLGGNPGSITVVSGTDSLNNINWFAGSLAGTAVSLASLSAGATSNNTISFTVANSLPANGKIQITYPAGFDISGVGAVATSAIIDGTFTVTLDAPSRVVTITRNNDGTALAPATVVNDLVITGVKNPGSGGLTGTFAISTLDQTNALIDSGTAAGVIITSGAISDAAVTLGSSITGQTSNNTYTFTTAYLIPVNGYVKVVYPAGFDISGAAFVSAAPSLGGAPVVSISGQEMTIQNTTGGVIVAGAFNIVVSGVVNPVVAGLTPVFTISTLDASNNPIESGTAPGINITAPGSFAYNSINCLAVYNGYMYAGSGATAAGNPTAKIFRTSDGLTWTQVNTTGFGDANNISVKTLATWNGKLIAGTENTVTGGQLWLSVDGTTWTKINTDGFGNADNRIIGAHVIYQQVQQENAGGLYFSTANSVNGAQIYVDPMTSTLSMTGSKTQASVGDIISYQVTIKNFAVNDLQNARIIDNLPPGFSLVSDSVYLDGVPFGNVTGTTTRIFNINSVNVGQTRTLVYQLRVGAGVEPGQKYKNTATASGTVLGVTTNYAEASWEVLVIADPVFDEGTVIGKVFHDKNGNGKQDAGEIGVPKARLVTEEGIIITTDEDGLYHLMGVLPKRHLIKIMPKSLPIGSYVTTPEEVLFETTNGLLSKVNFGVAYAEDETVLPPIQESPIRARFNDLFHNRVVKEAFFLNMTEGEISANSVKGNESIPRVNGRQYANPMAHSGRAAYYLDAKLARDFRLVSSLDTDRRQKRLFRNFDMRNYYPIYGDGSEADYSMTETQGKFYARLQKGPSYLLWGNYDTGITDSEVLQYSRTLYGLKGRYQTEAQTRFNEPYHKTILFSAQAHQVAAHDRFRATGTSLYYLKNRNIVEGTERVKVTVESEDTALPRQVIELSREDYVIYYPEGRVILKNPVQSYASSQSIVHDDIRQGDPVYLTVDYEYESKDFFEKSSFGGSVTQHFGDHFSLSGVQVREGKTDDNYELRGISAQLKLDEANTIIAEYGISQAESISSYISDNGGLSFSRVSSAGNTRGEALNIVAKNQWNKNFSTESYYKNIGAGFSQTSLVEKRGTEKMGTKATYLLTEATKAQASHDVTTYKDGLLLTPSSVPGSRREATSAAQVSHQLDERTLGTLEIKDTRISDSINPNVTNNGADFGSQNTTNLAAQAERQVNEKFKLTGRQQITVGGEANNQTGLGADLKIDEKTDVGLIQTVGSKGYSTQGILSRQINDKETIYLSANSGSGLGSRLEFGEKGLLNQSFTLGRSMQLDEKTTVTQETSLGKMAEDKVREKSKDFLSKFLTLERELTKNLSMRISLEAADLNQNTGDLLRNAFSASLIYTNNMIKNRLKIDYRKENGSSNGMSQTYLENEFEYQWLKDVTLLSKTKFASTSDQISLGLASFSEISLGFAFRPRRWDRFNMLARYVHLADDPLSWQTTEFFNASNQSNSDVFATDFVYDVTDRMQLVEKLALRLRTERIDPNPERHSTTSLWVNRLNYALYQGWGVAGEFRLLNEHESETLKGGFLFEIYKDIQGIARVSVGYNLTDFTDDLTDWDYQAQTVYFRVNTTMGSSSLTKKQVAN